MASLVVSYIGLQ